jgi:excisionase family DNA binding protein
MNWSIKMLTIEDVARELHISIMSVRRYIESGQIKAVKIGKVWRISQEELNRIMECGC